MEIFLQGDLPSSLERFDEHLSTELDKAGNARDNRLVAVLYSNMATAELGKETGSDVL